MAHCKHRVMDRCKKNGLPCTFESRCFEPEEPTAKTNADCIRSMSDEELAQRLLRYEGTETRATPYGGHEHIFHGPHGETCGTKEYALQLWMEWLDEPAEGV